MKSVPVKDAETTTLDPPIGTHEKTSGISVENAILNVMSENSQPYNYDQVRNDPNYDPDREAPRAMPGPNPEENPSGLSNVPDKYQWSIHTELQDVIIESAEIKCSMCNGVTTQQIIKLAPVPFPPGSGVNPEVIMSKAKRVACCTRCGNLKMGK